MSLVDAFVLPPFSVNQPIIDSLLLEPDAFEVYVETGAISGGTGTIGDPFIVNSANDFDALMNSFMPYTTIHLGPGSFSTQGHADGVGTGWSPRTGQKIVGAGVDVTILRLVPASPVADKAYFAIGGDNLTMINDFEASDFTINANQSGIAAAAAGGIKVYGSHILIKRIRVIAFGSRTLSYPGIAIATAGALPENPEPFNCVIEDCLIEDPAQNSHRESICISLASGEGQNSGVPAFHRGSVVQNCLVNCLYWFFRQFSGFHSLSRQKKMLFRGENVWGFWTGWLAILVCGSSRVAPGLHSAPLRSPG